jgi:hypothetical protein
MTRCRTTCDKLNPSPQPTGLGSKSIFSRLESVRWTCCYSTVWHFLMKFNHVESNYRILIMSFSAILTQLRSMMLISSECMYAAFTTRATRYHQNSDGQADTISGGGGVDQSDVKPLGWSGIGSLDIILWLDTIWLIRNVRQSCPQPDIRPNCDISGCMSLKIRFQFRRVMHGWTVNLCPMTQFCML